MKMSLPRALALAGVLAASGMAHAAPSVQMQTWYFPDGSNHTVMLTAQPGAAGAPDTRVLGAGPASGPMLLADEPAQEASNVVTQTWYFPDGSNHTMILPAGTGVS